MASRQLRSASVSPAGEIELMVAISDGQKLLYYIVAVWNGCHGSQVHDKKKCISSASFFQTENTLFGSRSESFETYVEMVRFKPDPRFLSLRIWSLH